MTVFSPFCGEFGFFIMFWIKIVHWHQDSNKIAYIRKGEEDFFPSVKEFIYD
jgi:hypothetical protein